MSLSRLNHWLPRCETHPKVVQGTAQFHHEITAALPPYADPVFDDATALDTAMDMVDPQPTLVELLVRHVRRRREFLPQIGINSNIRKHRVHDPSLVDTCASTMSSAGVPLARICSALVQAVRHCFTGAVR